MTQVIRLVRIHNDGVFEPADLRSRTAQEALDRLRLERDRVHDQLVQVFARVRDALDLDKLTLDETLEYRALNEKLECLDALEDHYLDRLKSGGLPMFSPAQPVHA